jgi:hypothetical protein
LPPEPVAERPEPGECFSCGVTGPPTQIGIKRGS